MTDPIAYHGEGPVWSRRWGGLRWVDMLAGDVLAGEACEALLLTPARHGTDGFFIAALSRSA